MPFLRPAHRRPQAAIFTKSRRDTPLLVETSSALGTELIRTPLEPVFRTVAPQSDAMSSPQLRDRLAELTTLGVEEIKVKTILATGRYR